MDGIDYSLEFDSKKKKAGLTLDLKVLFAKTRDRAGRAHTNVTGAGGIQKKSDCASRSEQQYLQNLTKERQQCQDLPTKKSADKIKGNVNMKVQCRVEGEKRSTVRRNDAVKSNFAV